jgi:5-methylcytosine-specific restriction endonuclease McrA
MFTATNTISRAMKYYLPSHKRNKIKRGIGVGNGKKKTRYYHGDRKLYREEYLKSEHWKILREEKLKLNPICEKCGNKNKVEPHHINYKNLYDVLVSDLQTLCRKCHHEEHSKKEVPKKRKKITSKLRPCSESSGYNILHNIFNNSNPNIYLMMWILKQINTTLEISSGNRGISKWNRNRIRQFSISKY